MSMNRLYARPGHEPARPAGAYDWWLIALVLILLCMGLLMVLSAGGIVGERLAGDKYYFFHRQMLFAGVGGVALVIAAVLPRERLNRWHYPLLFGTAALLVLTLTPLGSAVNGASRWISFSLFSVQPFEFAKIALALYLAYFMSAKKNLVRTFSRGVIPPFAVTIIMCVLLLLQPDFGGAAVLCMILLGMCVAGGTRFVYLFTTVALGIAIAATLVLHSPYRFRRVTSFLDPFLDAQDVGYQLVQSLLAFGSGGLKGVGMGSSSQKMLYLPEAHTDFIMAVLGEELGFLGVSIVMLVFLLFFVRCYRIILGQKEARDRLASFGLTLVLALGALFNLAVVLGTVPPKGVAMPFFSYGGSSLVCSMICVGLLLNYSRTARME
jgi:cell division protein FtsW